MFVYVHVRVLVCACWHATFKGTAKAACTLVRMLVCVFCVCYSTFEQRGSYMQIFQALPRQHARLCDVCVYANFLGTANAACTLVCMFVCACVFCVCYSAVFQRFLHANFSGTAKAACTLVELAGAKVAGCAFMIELDGLNGNASYKEIY